MFIKTLFSEITQHVNVLQWNNVLNAKHLTNKLKMFPFYSNSIDRESRLKAK